MIWVPGATARTTWVSRVASPRSPRARPQAAADGDALRHRTRSPKVASKTRGPRPCRPRTGGWRRTCRCRRCPGPRATGSHRRREVGGFSPRAGMGGASAGSMRATGSYRDRPVTPRTTSGERRGHGGSRSRSRDTSCPSAGPARARWAGPGTRRPPMRHPSPTSRVRCGGMDTGWMPATSSTSRMRASVSSGGPEAGADLSRRSGTGGSRAMTGREGLAR